MSKPINNPSHIKQNVSLSPYTTFKLGGPAEYFLEATEKEDIIEAISWAKEKNLALNFIGGGSNVLVSDQGVKGLLIKFSNNKVSANGERLDCGAGLPLAGAVSAAVSKGLSGLEWSAGIPRASVGGAVRGNAGAFGSSISESVETVEAFDLAKASFKTLSNKDCGFSYRSSLFKTNKRFVVWSSVLRLLKQEPALIRRKIQEAIDFRSGHYPNLPSAGSIFENLPAQAVKDADEALYRKALEARAESNGLIGAGFVIDECGLKGKRIGGIKVSLEHANHIVNTGSGTADEVAILISLIKQQARDRFGIFLREEIEYLGFDADLGKK